MGFSDRAAGVGTHFPHSVPRHITLWLEEQSKTTGVGVRCPFLPSRGVLVKVAVVLFFVLLFVLLTCHELDSSGKRKLQLRKWPHKGAL